MQHILLAANPEADQPWVADAAAGLAEQTGARVTVLAVDELELEALSPTPRSELHARAEGAAGAAVARLAQRGVEATQAVRPGRALDEILAYADEAGADMIVMGASARGRLAQRVLGSVPLAVVQRAGRPVLIVTEPAA